MDHFAVTLWQNLKKIRADKPLIHNITNFVVMNQTANVILAVGASPIMAHALEEVEEMVSLAGALVLNIGTLEKDWVEAMIRAGQKANEIGVPVVLDPVGAGATKLRTQAVKRILNQVHLSVLRANAAEAMAAADFSAKIRGVDSLEADAEKSGLAVEIARRLGTTVAITGKTDSISNGQETYVCNNGDAMLTTITGTGCSATAVTGCFLAVEKDPLLAAAQALSYYALCGEIAAALSKGPGSFETNLRDMLFTITEPQILAGLRVVKR